MGSNAKPHRDMTLVGIFYSMKGCLVDPQHIPQHIPQMIQGVKTSVGGVAGVAGGSWLAQYSVEIGVICMMIGATCSIGGLIYTVKQGKKHK
jgi:hypothetical protein